MPWPSQSAVTGGKTWNRIKGLITVKRGCDGTVKFKSVADGIPWARHAIAQHRGRRPLAAHIVNRELKSAVGPRAPFMPGSRARNEQVVCRGPS